MYSRREFPLEEYDDYENGSITNLEGYEDFDGISAKDWWITIGSIRSYVVVCCL